MVIENSKNHTPVNINVNGIQLEQVDQYRYLGVLITRDGRDENEIKCRIARARNTFNNLAIVLCDKRMNLQLRLRILRCYVWPLLKYAAETWTFKKALENKVNAFELWCYRRMLRIHWSDRVRNEEVLNKIGLGERILFELFKEMKSRFVRKLWENGLYRLFYQGKIPGKAPRRRKRKHMLSECESSFCDISLE